MPFWRHGRTWKAVGTGQFYTTRNGNRKEKFVGKDFVPTVGAGLLELDEWYRLMEEAVKATGAVISGPIPLPTHKRIYTVNRSTFVNKKAREQFQLSDYKRLIDIYSSTAKTVDALMKLELPSGVEVEIKV